MTHPHSLRQAAASISERQQRLTGGFELRVLASASITENAQRPWAKQRRRGYRCEHTILLERRPVRDATEQTQ